MLAKTLRNSSLRTLHWQRSVNVPKRFYATGGNDPAEFKARSSANRNSGGNAQFYLIGGIIVAVAGTYGLLMANPTAVANTGMKIDPDAREHMKPQTGERDPNYNPRKEGFTK